MAKSLRVAKLWLSELAKLWLSAHRLLPWPNIARGVRTVIGKSQWVIVYFVQPTNRPYCEP